VAGVPSSVPSVVTHPPVPKVTATAPPVVLGSPSAPRACASVDLAISIPSDSQFESTVNGSKKQLTHIDVKNTGQKSCHLDGWPGVAFFGNGMPVVCNGPADPACHQPPDETTPLNVTVGRWAVDNPADVVLAPGRSTSFYLMATADCTAPAIVRPYRMSVWVPGDSQALTVSPMPEMLICQNTLQVLGFGVLPAISPP
jgi:hypothetical protein